jgi:ketosteroid isomerase-like protein
MSVGVAVAKGFAGGGAGGEDVVGAVDASSGGPVDDDGLGFAAGLAEVIRRYLDAHDRHDTTTALSAFTPDAQLVDDGHTFQGADQIRTWLDTAAGEFTFTRTFTGAEAADAGTWLVRNHLEGDFPGGVVDLLYRFVTTDGLISELVIAP